MPATQHDLLLWISGSAYDVVFDVARDCVAKLTPATGMASELATVPAGHPGAAGSVLLLQQWSHEVTGWEALCVDEQQQVMGRTKPDSIELEDKPADSHVARTDQDEFGKIFRRNMPYGTVTDHGTIFVGISTDQRRLHRMLEQMAGQGGGPCDALTRYTTPLTGSYYFLPAI